MWWGFSQALDLIHEFTDPRIPKAVGKETTCNVLLIGQCDGRHMLKTIGQNYRHEDEIKVNIYVYEPLLENVARQLLFTTLALEPLENVGMAEKTLFFLELYGNTLLRPCTAKYLSKLSKCLLNVVTDENYGQTILPRVILKNLKYKEKDQLEVIFKYWASNDGSFNILKAWNEKVRKTLGMRYDSRFGVYDWDYHMRYHCFGADTLNLQEYKRFREKGISFYNEDTDPCVPNRTLASAIFSAGSKIINYGYLGDTVSGPYPTFGFDCEDKDLMKKINGKIQKTATDITKYNIMKLLHEIQYQSPFKPLQEDNECNPALLVDTCENLKIKEAESYDQSSMKIKIKDGFEVYESLGTGNCKIIFMPTSALNDYPNKSEYFNYFNLMFVSQTMVFKCINSNLIKMVKPKSKIIVETPKYILNYRKENLEMFKNDLINLMDNCQCKLLNSYNSETDEFARFIVDKQD